MNSMYLHPPGTLWVHAAGYNNGNSMFGLSLVYDALCRGEDCLIFAWDETEKLLQNWLHSMHSYHRKFSDLHDRLPNGVRGLPVEDVRSGLRTPEEQALYVAVLQDLSTLGCVRICADVFSVEQLCAQIDASQMKKPRVLLRLNSICREEGIVTEDHYGSLLASLQRVARDKQLAIQAAYAFPRGNPRGRDPSCWKALFPSPDFYRTPDLLTVGRRESEQLLSVWCLRSRLGNPGPSGPGVVRGDSQDAPRQERDTASKPLGLAWVDAGSMRLVWEEAKSLDECLIEEVGDSARAAAYLSKVLEESAGEPEMIRAALENVGRAHGWRKPGTKMEPAEAEQALRDLSAYYKEPVMPVGRYCRALEAWARCIADKRQKERTENRGPSWGNSWEDHVHKVFLNIRKSNLLYRLIYRGLPLRTRPCPLHKGRWSGIQPDPCPHGCSEGHNVTGWLLPEDKTP